MIVKIEVSFEGQGNASSWHEKLLAKIDKCFVHNYHKSGASYRLLFSLESSKNINQFTKYCTDIDKTLLENAKIARRNCLRDRIKKCFSRFSCKGMASWKICLNIMKAK